MRGNLSFPVRRGTKKGERVHERFSLAPPHPIYAIRYRLLIEQDAQRVRMEQYCRAHHVLLERGRHQQYFVTISCERAARERFERQCHRLGIRRHKEP